MKTKFKRLLAITLAAMLLFGGAPMGEIDFTVPASAEGEITLDAGVSPASGATYTIANAEQLKRLSDIVKGGNSCAGITFVLTADIVLNDGTFSADESGNPLYNGNPVDAANQPEKWFPIGCYYDLDGSGGLESDEDIYFSGIFDGGLHTISGLFLDNTAQTFVGLFGQINSDAQIKNVGVINSYISGHNRVGGVCGYNYYGTIESCYNTGSVSGTGNYVGGVCGYSYNSAIANCYNTGSVSGTGDNVGGVCGYSYNSAIANCYNTGSVSGTSEVGGVCGGNNGTITNCYNTGSVSSISVIVGGVCGMNWITITNCYNTGSVSGTDDYVGGVCGRSANGSINNSYNTGSVSGTGNYVGGVCGWNTYSEINNCYNTGSVSGGSSVGGVCGYTSRTINNCYYLDSSCLNAGGGASQTEAEMKDAAFAAALGSAFMPSFYGLNDGYPLLAAFYTFEGEGTAEAPYLIYDAVQLCTMRNLVNFDNANYGDKQYKLMADIVLNDGTFTVDDDLNPWYNDAAVSATNQPEKWFPIGCWYDLDNSGEFESDEDIFFKGIFDGNNHTVSGLYFDNSSQSYVGLFGQIDSGAQIKNVGVINSYIRCKSYVSGVCGFNVGTVENCYNTGSVVGVDGYVGGVCGNNRGDSITNCYNTGSVSSISVMVGGVCGMNWTTITNCYNTGSVSGRDDVGGVCGRSSNGLINNCYNTGTAIGKEGYVGGVCGWNTYSEINNCYNTGSVSGGSNVGGTCGYTGRTINNCYYLDSSCLNSGGGISKAEAEMKKISFAVTLGSAFMPSFYGLNDGYPLLAAFYPLEGEGTAENPYLIYNETQLCTMRNLVNFDNANYGHKQYKLMADIKLNTGTFTVDDDFNPWYNDAAVSAENQPEQWFPIGCYYDLDNSGEFESDEDIYFSGVFDGNNHTVSGLYFDNSTQGYVGLFGQINSGAQIKNVGVINSYIRGKSSVGGVCGNSTSTITNCYNTGSVNGNADIGGVCGYNAGAIENCYNTGIVRGTVDNVGGVCGNNHGGSTTNCCNTGIVSGEGNNIGGVCGYVYDGTVINCYNTGIVRGVGAVGGVCGANDGTITNCYNTGSVNGKAGVGGVCGENDEESQINNCYYLDTSCAQSDGGTSKTESKFNSGEVCYLLNSEITDGTQAFYQNLGTNADRYPTLDNTHGTVYSDYDRCFISYSNADDALSSEPVAHTYTVFTANGDGTHNKACSVCPEGAEGHTVTEPCSFGEWAVVTPATCTAKGSERCDCESCDYFETRETDIIEHEWNADFTIDTDATCTAAGSKSIHCKNCTEKKDITEIPMKAHTYGAWVSNSNGTHTRACTACDETAEGHFDTAGCTLTATVTPPTCTANGYTTHTCADCGYSYTNTETAATGHTYGAWHFEGGSIVHTCSCGKEEDLFTVIWLSLVKIFNSVWIPAVTVFNAIWVKIAGLTKATAAR